VSTQEKTGSVGPVGPAGNIPMRTGDWASTQPEIDPAKCNTCLLCWIFCPDGSIVREVDADGKQILTIDYDYCKGCGICERECPRDAIKMVER
jgi:2-oxoacid:acceptor oxidoreductase delta subunit (pyruvate/2-ketoisovalerate family)